MRLLLLLTLSGTALTAAAQPLGLPPLPIPADNPQTPEKVELGERLFNDVRFSSTGAVSCANCHAADTAFTDALAVSQGIDGLLGTRNAPTVVNAAYNETQFWDGRSPTLEDQALHPFLNPVEMAMPSHDALLEIIREDREYVRGFRDVFDVRAEDITIEHVTKAIAAFERTQISGDSPFDRWYFGGEAGAISPAAQRGFEVFLTDGRCVSCHMIEQDHALFTDHQFHNVGIGINDIQNRAPELAKAFLIAKNEGIDVDVAVLGDADTSHLGRFAVTDDLSMIGAFKTPTLRNVARTAPYMHDGSLATLREVIEHYNNGGVTPAEAPVNPYISGGIRPLELTEQQMDDLVAFMEALTSPQFEELAEPEPVAGLRPQDAASNER
ncbi:MAG: c-type cytochrome [Gammaproteobacteria bacterium]|nr:c-type cytochrome [Gammaproteobacteria bacterium]